MRLLPFLFLMVALAGCFGGDSSEPDAEPMPEPAAPEPAPHLRDQEVALAQNLIITQPERLLDGPLQTFGTALASYGNGTRLAVAGVIDGDYHVRTSDDAGTSWSAPVQATEGVSATTHSAQAASIDFGGRDELYLSWSGSSGIQFTVSRDGGTAWAEPAPVDADGSGLDGFTDMGANEAGRIAVIWLRGQTEGGTGAADTVRGYYGAVSEDGGATWTVEQMPGANEPCDCCGAAVVMREDGTAFGLWRNIYNPGPQQARDYTLSVNVPGQGWSQPQRLEPDDWRYNGCPASASAMSLALDGTVTATWWTGAAQSPGYHLGTIAPGSTELVHQQALQSDAPASASASATDGLGNAWALWADEATNPTTLRLAREEGGVYQVLGTFEGDWPRMVGTPDGFVAVFMDGDRNLQMLRGAFAESPAVLGVSAKTGLAPMVVEYTLQAAGGVAGDWTFDDGMGNIAEGTADGLPARGNVTYDGHGTYTMRFTIAAANGTHESKALITVARDLQVPDPATFSAGQPLVSCQGSCLSASGPDAPVIDGFWSAIDDRYWGLAAAVKGDVSNIGGDGTGTVIFYDADLNELAAGKNIITPDGAVHAFSHGTFSIWGGSAAYEDMHLVFSMPGVA